jgi:hypothetical protein
MYRENQNKLVVYASKTFVKKPVPKSVLNHKSITAKETELNLVTHSIEPVAPAQIEVVTPGQNQSPQSYPTNDSFVGSENSETMSPHDENAIRYAMHTTYAASGNEAELAEMDVGPTDIYASSEEIGTDTERAPAQER